PGLGGDCSNTLDPGDSCTIELQYAPLAVGSHNDTIEFAYNNGVSGQTSNRTIQGTSISPANLTISDSNPYSYGSIAETTSATHFFTITNTGNTSATAIVETGLAAPFAFVGGSFPGTGGTCTTTIAPAGSCS